MLLAVVLYLVAAQMLMNSFYLYLEMSVAICLIEAQMSMNTFYLYLENVCVYTSDGPH
jgi:hypothetical protein